MKDHLEDLINEETAKRLEIMEQPDYEFPKRMGKGDFVIIAVAVAVSLVLIALCMTGVIA